MRGLWIVLLVIGCHRGALPGPAGELSDLSGQQGGGVDAAIVSGCVRPPPPCASATGCTKYGAECTQQVRGQTVSCVCDGDQLYCNNDCACSPSGPPSYMGTGPCARVGAVCRVSLEGTCQCVGPEMQWVCCGGQSLFDYCGPDLPAEGALCACRLGGSPSGCDYGCTNCKCIDYHWRCTRKPGGCDGGP